MVRRYFGAYGATHYGYYAKRPRPAPPARARKLAPEEAALRVQAAARGFLARRTVRAVRAVDREAERVAARVKALQACGGDAGAATLAVAEELMRLLLRLDAVRGARTYRRRVVATVLALQDAVDRVGGGGGGDAE